MTHANHCNPKQLTFRLRLVCLVLTLLVLSACSGSSSSPGTVSTPVATALTLSPTGASTTVGGTKQFAATALYSDNSQQDVTASAAWSSSNSAVASVESTGQSNPGLVTGVSSGTVNITASFSGKSAVTALSVSGVTPVVTSMTVAPTNASVSVGGTQQFSATAGYSDGSSKIVTSSATWSSSDSTIAPIESAGQSSPGLASGMAPGNVNITALFGGVSAVTVLNVTGSGTLTSFFIGQINPSIAPGAKLQMFGYAEYSDGSAVWVTSSTNWVSSNPAVAAIQDTGQTSPGLVTASAGAAGTVKITASFGGLIQSTNVTVVTNAVPVDLMDMTSSSQNYLGFAGGLYEDNSNMVPASHDTAGKTAAAAVQARDQSGKPSATGAVVFLGIGMSNATEEFSAFLATAASSSLVNHTTLAMEDGASGAATACYWTVATGQTTVCPGAKGVLLENQYDRVRDEVLATATKAPSAPAGCSGPPNPTPCLTENQVQVLWIKNANPRPGIANMRTLCDTSVVGCVNDIAGTEAILYESQLGQIVRAAKLRYPNLQQVFLSTRIYAGYATDGLNPEPYAYEYGFSAKWLLKAQIVQEGGGAQDLIAGDMSYTNGGPAAWTAWGTYLWADGNIPRSDNLVWLSSDFQSDGTHPNAQGTTKVVNLLMGFYTTSAYTTWFRP